jgi:hypothetical protein
LVGGDGDENAAMLSTPSGYASMHNILTQTITVGDIAESLVSLDGCSTRDEFRSLASARDFDVLGARAQGLVMGYVDCARLPAGDGPVDVEFVVPEAVISQDTPLPLAIVALETHRRVFVEALGGICGIATRDDLEKAPARMWLFGVLTLVETALRRIVRGRHADGGWTELLSASRVARGEKLADERLRRGEIVDALDCLQFEDLGNLVARHEDIRELFHFSSRRATERRMKEWAKLRNHIAHSQGYVRANWPLLVRIANESGGLRRLLDLQ